MTRQPVKLCRIRNDRRRHSGSWRKDKRNTTGCENWFSGFHRFTDMPGLYERFKAPIYPVHLALDSFGNLEPIVQIDLLVEGDMMMNEKFVAARTTGMRRADAQLEGAFATREIGDLKRGIVRYVLKAQSIEFVDRDLEYVVRRLSVLASRDGEHRVHRAI